MPAHFAHKTYKIDVNLLRNPFRRGLFTPTVDVGEGGKLLVNIGTSKAFLHEKDAEEYGLELAKTWIENGRPLANL